MTSWRISTRCVTAAAVVLLASFSATHLSGEEPPLDPYGLANATVEQLAERLRDGNPRVRLAAVDRLVAAGERRGVAAALAEGLFDEHVPVRHAARKGLAEMKYRAQPAVPVLARAVALGPPETQRLAAHVLAGLGPLASPAVPALFGMLEDPDPRLRDVAARAIRAIRARPSAQQDPASEP